MASRHLASSGSLRCPVNPMARVVGRCTEVRGGWLMKVIQMGKALPRSAFFAILTPYSICKLDFIRTTT